MCVCILMHLVASVPSLQKNPQTQPRTSLWVQICQVGEGLVVPSQNNARTLKSEITGVRQVYIPIPMLSPPNCVTYDK